MRTKTASPRPVLAGPLFPILFALAAVAAAIALSGGKRELDSGRSFASRESGGGTEITAEARWSGTDAGVAVDPAWQEAASAAIARAEYAASPTAAGLEAPNRAQGLRTTFRAHGIDVVPRVHGESEPAWRFSWETVGVGRNGAPTWVASSTQPESEGARVTYRHDGWTEWYENRADGIEQGFTIDARPDGHGPLHVTGRFPLALRAAARDDGAVDFLDSSGACVIRYGELHAWDARGRELRSGMTVDGESIALVIEDDSAEYPLTIDPILSAPIWTAEPNQTNSVFGHSVSTAGDVNGDGYSDVIIGAWLYDNGQTDEGRAYVYLGSAVGLSVSPAWTAESNQTNAFFGYSVATAGDVNGDGFDDVIVGAFLQDNGQTDEGRAFLYLGSSSGLSVAPAWSAECNQAGAQFGSSVATAGDVDLDGFDDVIIGAPLFTNDQSNEGRAFLYKGSAGGLSASPVWTGEGNQAGVQFGASVASAGDVNADRFADVVVGARVYTNGEANEGRAFVFHGSTGGLHSAPDWTAESNKANAFFGVCVARAGDLNGDGYGDVIIGADGFSNGESGEGRALVYHGSATGLAASPAWTWESNFAGASLGHAVATAGDVNGDGFADVLIGAHNLSFGNTTEGRVYLFSGSRTGLSNATAWFAEGEQTGANLGISVATAGDVNGDGHSDLLIGAWTFDNGQTDEGRAFVYYGAADGLQTSGLWFTQTPTSSDLGHCVASAGDVNGDGYSDVILGAPGFNNGEQFEGAVFVFHGSANGLGLVPAWQVESDQTLAFFGSSAASAGDVNGDGYSDVIVGAYVYDAGQSAEGRAFVYLGSPNGLSTTPAWTAEGNSEDLYFGGSVACAGDVNGDGFSDVIVGAIGNVFLGNPLGWAYVYFGSAGGLSPTPGWSADGGQIRSAFGCSVASAGDVNGDGYSDIVVGAREYSNVGRAVVYHGSSSGPSLSPSWVIDGDQVLGRFGNSVASAGDVNGDGFSDLAVGANGHHVIHNEEGMVTVFHGSATGLGIANWSVHGDGVDAGLGSSVATAGDINGDGYSDLIVGSPFRDGASSNQGRALVYHGSSIGLSSSPSTIVELNQPDAHVGASVASAGDVDGDGWSDVLVGAPGYTSQSGFGIVLGLDGNGGRGLDRTPRQLRVNGTTPIASLARSDSPSSFVLKALGRSAAGRDVVRLEIEVKPFGVPFNGSGVQLGSALDTGLPNAGTGSSVALTEVVGGLTAETYYHWRLRLVSDSPFFPRTPWMVEPHNAETEADLRTASPTSEVSTAQATGGVHLDPIRSNPIRQGGEISFALAHSGVARLTLFDIAGRERVALAEGSRVAGRHSLRWDGRDASGARLPAGVYLLRLECGGEVATTKLVLAR